MTPRGVSIPRSATILFLIAVAMLFGGRVNACSPSKGSRASAAAQALPSASPSPTATPEPTPTATAGPTKPPAPPRKTATPITGIRKKTGNAAVALTFDDGPSPAYTPQLLNMLRAHRVKATFCLVGTQVRDNPGLVARIVREGHTLCNHSWHHEMDLGKQPAAVIRANLERTNAEIRRAVPNARIAYFRQPGGLWSATSVAVAKQLGMTPLGWSVDPQDWRKVPAGAITSRVLAHTRKGSIVLLHDGGGDRRATMAACRTLIPALKRNYRLIPL